MANDIKRHLIFTTLTCNSTTLYSYENTTLLHKLNNLNCSEIISQELGLVNSTKSLMGSIPIPYRARNSSYGEQINLVLYFMKRLLENNDLITIVTIVSTDINKVFTLGVLKKIMDDYVDFRENINNDQNPNVNSKLRLGEFKLVMNQIIKFEEQNYDANILNLANEDLDDVRDLMVDNIERVLERGERINLLVNKTSMINNSANAFRRRTNAIKRKMWWNNVKLVTILILLGLFVFYLLIGSECGLPFYSKCIHSSKPKSPTA